MKSAYCTNSREILLKVSPQTEPFLLHCQRPTHVTEHTQKERNEKTVVKRRKESCDDVECFEG